MASATFLLTSVPQSGGPPCRCPPPQSCAAPWSLSHSSGGHARDNCIASLTALPNIRPDRYREISVASRINCAYQVPFALVAHQYSAHQSIALQHQAAIVCRRCHRAATVDRRRYRTRSRAEYFDARYLQLHRPVLKRKCRRPTVPVSCAANTAACALIGRDQAKAMLAKLRTLTECIAVRIGRLQIRSSTRMPRAQAMPASRASAALGLIPVANTSRSQGSFSPIGRA